MIAGYFTGIDIRIYQVTGLRYETTSGIIRYLLMNMERLSCFFATHIVAESLGVKNMLLADNITSKDIQIIGCGNINGIDFDYWNVNLVDDFSMESIKSEFNINQFTYVFIFVGRIVKDKGINELAFAFDKLSHKYSNVKLIILGESENSLDPISEMANDILKSNDNILVLGFKEDIRPYLNISNCLVLPSYREGFPNVILQAGAMGKPVIMSPVNGHDEYLNTNNGQLINVKDVHNLYDVMESHCIGSKVYFSEVITSFVKSNFSQKLLYPQLLEFYKSL
jgi:glycosyltransferase involved in cell wall biosynthesis